jgi:flagellar motor switch protein FliN/FliY
MADRPRGRRHEWGDAMSDGKGKLELQDLGASHETGGRGINADHGARQPQEADVPSPDKPPAARGTDDLGAVYDIPVQLSAVLGKATMPVSQLLRLGRGAVVELDRKVGESIDILVNNRLVARGEVVILDDRLGVTMTEIIKTEQ